MATYRLTGLEIGVALGEVEATAVMRAAGATRRVTVPVDPGDGTPDCDALAAAFRRIRTGLAEQVGGEIGPASVSVALMPPLADARLIRLPPLKRTEAESVIRRDAARHFVGGAGPLVVAASPAAAEDRSRSGAVFLGAAAAAALVETLHAAAAGAGWRLRRVIAAHGAWIDAASSVRGSGTVLAAVGDTLHIMRVERGRCMALRRTPAGHPDMVLEAVGAGPGDAVLFAEAGVRERLKTTLAGAGWHVDEGRLVTAGEAAAGRAGRAPLEFVTASTAARRRERGRRNLVRVAAAAVVLAGAAAAVELWGVHRELDAVLADRAAIRAQVAPLLATRDSVDRIDAGAETVHAIALGSPHWTRALFDLALLLPRDAHITSLHTTGDTLVIEATADRAGPALQALRRAGSLEEIRLLGTIERDLEAGTTASERFRLTARLKPPVAQPSVDTAPAGRPGTGDGGGRP